MFLPPTPPLCRALTRAQATWLCACKLKKRPPSVIPNNRPMRRCVSWPSRMIWADAIVTIVRCDYESRTRVPRYRWFVCVSKNCRRSSRAEKIVQRPDGVPPPQFDQIPPKQHQRWGFNRKNPTQPLSLLQKSQGDPTWLSEHGPRSATGEPIYYKGNATHGNATLIKPPPLSPGPRLENHNQLSNR
jgi:hypothetical protein